MPDLESTRSNVRKSSLISLITDAFQYNHHRYKYFDVLSLCSLMHFNALIEDDILNLRYNSQLLFSVLFADGKRHILCNLFDVINAGCVNQLRPKLQTRRPTWSKLRQFCEESLATAKCCCYG